MEQSSRRSRHLFRSLLETIGGIELILFFSNEDELANNGEMSFKRWTGIH